jgi:hypothetical protein
MKAIFSTICLLTTLLFLSGCFDLTLPVSLHPLADGIHDVEMPCLEGTWSQPGNSGVGDFQFLPDEDGGYQMIMNMPTGGDPDEESPFVEVVLHADVVCLADRYYLDLVTTPILEEMDDVDGDEVDFSPQLLALALHGVFGSVPVHHIVHLECDDEGLKLQAMDSDLVTSDKVTLPMVNLDSYLLITASTGELLDFFAENHHQVFDPDQTARYVKVP